MYYEILPDTLRAHRNRLGWTQEKLAYEARVERRTIIKKENAIGPVRTRRYLAEKLSNALGISVLELTKPIREEYFQIDQDVFKHMRRAIEVGDNFHLFKLIDLVTYDLAEVLDGAGLELAADWMQQALAGPRPMLPYLPAGPADAAANKINEDHLYNFMHQWYLEFGDGGVDVGKFRLADVRPEFRESIKNIPVIDRGEINIFWLKSYMRVVSGRKVGPYLVRNFPTLDRELWHVLRNSE